MFRRISGSSSITKIFFMAFSKCWQLHRHGRAFAQLALDLHFLAVQGTAALHQQQAESGAGTRSDVAAARKGAEQMLLILLRNAYPLIADHADHVASVLRHKEMHRCSRL